MIGEVLDMSPESVVSSEDQDIMTNNMHLENRWGEFSFNSAVMHTHIEPCESYCDFFWYIN